MTESTAQREAFEKELSSANAQADDINEQIERAQNEAESIERASEACRRNYVKVR